MIIKHLNILLQKLDYRLEKLSTQNIAPDMEKEFLDAYSECRKYSMTSPQRMYAAYKSAEYIASNNIPGSIVECGVWKGGSIMIMINKFMQMKSTDRNVYLYDTYEGMTEPTDKDIEITGRKAKTFWMKMRKGESSEWCYASLEEVKENMKKTGYPFENFTFVKGKVEDTIPKTIPDKIAILRLDTDWFDSTYHELKHLFPRLSPKGILIIDDYGHWRGSREAVDQYFKENGIVPMLNRVDYSGRLYIKQ